MPTDKTPQVPETQANELDEGQLDEVAGGLLPAVKVQAAADGSVRIGQPVTFTATVNF